MLHAVRLDFGRQANDMEGDLAHTDALQLRRNRERKKKGKKRKRESM